MSKSLHLPNLLGLPFVKRFLMFFLLSVSFNAAIAQTVTTDKNDYLPGDYVLITGTGWYPGSQVRMVIEHSTFTHTSTEIFVTVNEDGTFSDQSYLIEDYHLGETFTLWAYGKNAENQDASEVTYFTDGCPKIQPDLESLYTFCSSSNGSLVVSINTGGNNSGTVECWNTSTNTKIDEKSFDKDHETLTFSIPNSTTTYNVQFILKSTGCNDDIQNTTVKFVDPEPQAFTLDVAIPCNNADYRLSGSTLGAIYVFQKQDQQGDWSDVNNSEKTGTGNPLVWVSQGSGIYRVKNITCDITSNIVNTVNGFTSTLITNQPDNAEVCAGEDVTFTVEATGTNIAYQWYNGGGAITGENSASLTITDVDPSDAGDYYVIVSGCTNATSTSATLVVKPITAIETQPVDLTTCEDLADKKLSVVGSGTNLHYQWYQTDAPANDGDEVGTDDDEYAPDISTPGVFYFYVVVSGDCGDPVKSDVVEVTVNPNVAITTQPTDLTTCEDETGQKLTVTGSGGGLHYQWYQTDNPANDGDAVGTDDDEFSPDIFVPGTFYFYVIVSGDCGEPVKSNVVTVTVDPNTTIETQPTDLTTCEDLADKKLSVTGSGSNLHYQWYQTDAPANDGDKVGTDDDEYAPDISIPGTYYYYVIVAGDCGEPVKSDVVEVTVNANVSISTQPSDLTTCEDETGQKLTVVGSGGGLHYQWYQTDNPANDGDEVGTDDDDYSPDVTAPGTYYYYVIVSGDCGEPVKSNVVTVTVHEKPTLASATQASAVCAGSPATINLTGLVASRNIDIKYSINGTDETDKLNVTVGADGKASFNTRNLTTADDGKTLTIKTIAFHDPYVCSYDADYDLTLDVKAATVAPAPVITPAGPVVYGCDQISMTESATGEGTLQYEWHHVFNGVDTKVGINQSSYVVDEVLQAGDHFYYVKVKGECGDWVTSASTKLTVNPQPVAPPPAGESIYTGPTAAWAPTTTANAVTVTLAGFVKNGLPCGDIATARMSFFYRLTGTAAWTKVSNGQKLPVSYVDPSNPAAGGTASVIAQLNIASTESSTIYEIKIEISGNYSNSFSIFNTYDAQMGQIIVSRAQSAGSIAGGAKLKSPSTGTNPGSSTGYVKATTLKSDISIQLDYVVKSGKAQNPKGKVWLVVKSYYDRTGKLTSEQHTYRINSNSIASLNITVPTANFTAKANIAEVKNPGTALETVEPIEGNCTMVLDLEDKVCGENKSDLVGVVVYRNAGGIWYSNNYTGAGVTKPTEIACGGICVANTKCTATSIATGTIGQGVVLDEINQRPTAQVATELNARIYPNPSTNVFNLTFTGGTKEKLDVTVMDVSGRTVKVYKVDPIGTFRFGDGLRPGVYMIQVKQGTSNRVFKVIKQ
ncbi:MAG TPA: T9SS type A sorting domain-containing protein [Chitinophagaceae bacterium]|nr:T9SS type A sorting domain-containing protein [Chitinophagaceae bacterium]